MNPAKSLVISAILVFGSTLVIQAQSPSDRSQTQSNMRQLALGSLAYAADYDLILPAATSSRSVAFCILPYARSLDLWRPVGQVSGVTEFNLAMAGVDTNHVDITPTLVLFYQSKPDADGIRAVAQLDSAVKELSPAAWEKASRDLKGKFPKGASRMLPRTWGFGQVPADFRSKK
ncbi:MAG TPA: hypothetical protein PLO61_09620 [Fimbriimonadaceae bacterium]|nr:hypothetical protein [Fimbriimonadaceae bacterium]HRJ32916.1 hypothetical protein [Fimbriimonadaceae bacterium]